MSGGFWTSRTFFIFCVWGFFFLSTERCERTSVFHPRTCRLLGSWICSGPDRGVESVYKRPPRDDPEAEAAGSLAGSVGNVVRAGAARQRGYSSAAVSAEHRGCMTHPINGSLAAFRRRRTHYTSSLENEPFSLLSLWLQQSRDPAQPVWWRSRTVSCLWWRTGEQSSRISAAALHSGNTMWS